jgi:glycosyltransferase involved in cell wall biosynthesis
MKDNKIPVAFLQRKARKVGNYSVEFIFEDVRFRLLNKISAAIWYSKYESEGLFKRLYNCIEAASRQTQVTHVTGDINYLGLFLSSRKTIHTILDCVFLDRSSGISHKVLKFFWLTIPVKRSRFITAISESTKKEILKYSNCNPEKIIVIPVAISEKFKRKDKPFNKKRPVVLQIGTAPNKNLPRLIDALKGIDCQLNIVGKYEQQYEAQLKQNGIDYIYQSGLTDEEMIRKYEEADIISFASLYEGFGMPILEAQATGRVVVTANVYSMPEVAGNAACLVDPSSVESIRNGLLKVIQEDSYREELIERGFENIKRFHPEKIANQYFELYKKIALPEE